MKSFLPCVALLFSLGALAAPNDPRQCELIGQMARVITQDREMGVSYKAEIAKMRAASAGVPTAAGILKISTAIVNTVYKDSPRMTPEGAERLHAAACLASN